MSISLTDNNPLYNPEYLLGPIETIVCSHQALTSGHLSLHDITEAYRTLSMRIRQSSRHLSVMSDSFPALELLRDRDADVVTALRRDILRAVPISAWHPSSNLSPRSPGTTAVTVSWELAMYNTDHAEAFSTLCHYALRLLSEIFRLPALSSVFTMQDLGLLLGDVTFIISHPRLVSPSASKTTTLLTWIIRTQRLPKDVLLPRIEDLILSLELILEATVRDTYVAVIVVDALICIVNLLTFHRHIFVAPLAGLLPSVFPLVMHPSSELRHHTAVVLATFSHTLITYRTLVGESTVETICSHTHSFLTPETTRHPTSSRKLPPLLDTVVSSKDFGGMGKNSPWALTIVASFTVLLGPSLFLHQGPLKLVMNTAQKALRHQPGRDLNPHVWRTFIWSMTQLFMQRSAANGDIDIIQRCVLVLKQALHAGLGAALIVSLLEMTSTDLRNNGAQRWSIRCVIDIIHDMLSSKYQDIRGDAYRILRCLMRAVETTADIQPSWAADTLLSPFLFDGSLLHADRLQIKEMVGTTITSPRSLSQEEILMHWCPISSCFVLVVRNCLEYGDADLTTTAIPMWQTLLRAQAQPIQGNDRSPASTDFDLQLSSLLSHFLPESCVPLSGEPYSIEIQLQSLVVANQLWTVVQNIVSQPSLIRIASSFLVSILQRSFYLSDREVLTSWSLLCSALIAIGIPNLLEFISHHDDTQSALEIKKHLWRVIATNCDGSKRSSRENSISVLLFPIGSWSMSEDDLDIWEQALEWTLSAVATSAEAMGIIDDITSKCPEIGRSFSINAALRIARAILRHLNLDKVDSFSKETLSYLHMTVTVSYPPQPSMVDAAGEFMMVFHHAIITMPVSLLEPVVLAVQTGLAVWIEDKEMSLSEEQYNDLVMPLYDSLLIRLQSLPLSVTRLNAFVPLLTAAFSRIPPPALGPAAFRRFFYAVHARLSAPSDAYNDELRVCLDACVRAYGGEWPSGIGPLSSSSQTQTQILTTEAPIGPTVCEVVEEYIPSIEHEVIPDSQFAISNAVLVASSQQRLAPRSSRPISSELPNPLDYPCPARFVTVSSKESDKLHERTSPPLDTEMKKHLLPRDAPPPKRHRSAASSNYGLRSRSVLPTRVPSPIVRGRRSTSTPKPSPHNRLLMDCVEVIPFRRLLNRREADAERNDKRRQQHKKRNLDDYTFNVTPERPFAPRSSRGLPERDEIVPETPDAVLRPGRVSLPTGKESSPGGSGCPTRLGGRAQPVEGVRTISTRLASALRQVHDVFSRPGVSQIPVEELADSAQLLDAANEQLRMALARNASKNVIM
ncbi:hypothetical protein F5148DRAFT_1197378 [Russula earlei]|uniref:Uncharacterized protein n=1 Tax=Russula earlei TaxID=71964 RepID=A0ACC0U9L4_9AGAM|nr:hypothetical protein F5148DRAFT_1197378 [Russula earlei]